MSLESAMECGVHFVKAYYRALATDVTQLTSMYVSGSQLVTETGSIKSGDIIPAYLEQKAAEQSKKFAIEAIGAYPGVADSVLVLVRGTILTADSTRKFNQVFSLAKRDASKYYIQNDVLEIVDSATQETQAEVEQPAPVVVEETYEPAVEEPEPEPTPAPVEDLVAELNEPEPEQEPEPVVEPTPAPREQTPEPEVEKEEEEPASTGWAAIARKKKTGSAKPAVVQRIAGGTIPGVVAAKSKEETDKRGVSPSRARKGPAPAPKQTFSVYVSGLPADTTEDDISKAFGKYGTLAGKKLFADKFYCFVDFAEKADMQKVLDPNTVAVKGTNVKVSAKRPNTGAAPGGADKAARPARPAAAAPRK